ncbi:response regulator [Cerasicoccus arenae]|uniref:DNA-binding response regulator n=1 Tax=Cerasicoccus arenae TaxID=424488 RepID=A0A8J3GDS5_9BACT|nr:response regulator transcription factor [Cerasicoccus arenae]MBK1858973.1 response regulator transcription factor [Cerasicoccus arenae]GHC04179.1 DNA-binding response regulator [Cerasicoccus arenae]
MKRIVVIEDQKILREFIKVMVQNFPMLELVGDTGDGLEGYNLIKEHKPDMIILDVVLPGLNGISMLKRLSKEMPDVLVLGFSSFSNRSQVRQMIEAGANGLVQKTESLQVLETAIKMVAEGQTYFSPNISIMMRDLMLNPSQVETADDLTFREREILQLIAESNSNKEIAEKLGISVKTAETHRNRIINKLNIHDAPGLTRYAIASGLVGVN